MLVQDISLQEDPHSPVDHIIRDGAALDRHLVKLRINVASANGLSQSLSPEPQFFILTNGSKEIVGCDTSGSFSMEQSCLDMHGQWDGSKCNLFPGVQCSSGYLTGINSDGSANCASAPEAKSIAVKCPSGQVLTGVDSAGAPICVSGAAPTLDISCPSGQVLTGIHGGSPVCADASAGSAAVGNVMGYCVETVRHPLGWVDTVCRNENLVAPAFCKQNFVTGEPVHKWGEPILCSCPAGYTPKQLGDGSHTAEAAYKGTTATTMFTCVKI